MLLYLHHTSASCEAEESPVSSTSSTTSADHGEQLSTGRVVSAYLDALYAGDFENARRLVADDLSFSGPFIQVDRADAFFASAKPLRQFVRGHRTIKQWENGNEVSTLYEMNLETPAGKGSVLASEWNTVRSGKIVRAMLVFDTAAFRKVVPQPAAPLLSSEQAGRPVPADS